MVLARILAWWRRRPALHHLQVVLYTRQGCHLCETAWNGLRRAQRRHGFALSAIDVDTDAALAARHGGQVPVIVVDGKVRFWGRINWLLVERLLVGETRRRQRMNDEV